MILTDYFYKSIIGGCFIGIPFMFSSCDDSDNDNDLLLDENKTPAIEESLNTNINSIVESGFTQHKDSSLYYSIGATT